MKFEILKKRHKVTFFGILNNFLFCVILLGFFTWALLTTLVILLVVIKRLVLAQLQCKCVRCNRLHQDSVPPDQHQSQQLEPIQGCLANPSFAILNTPPSLATTPSTPSTVTSERPLVSLPEPVAARTRAKIARKLTL